MSIADRRLILGPGYHRYRKQVEAYFSMHHSLVIEEDGRLVAHTLSPEEIVLAREQLSILVQTGGTSFGTDLVWCPQCQDFWRQPHYC